MNTKLNIVSAVKEHIELSFEYVAINADQSFVADVLNSHWHHDLPAVTALTYHREHLWAI